MLCYMLMMIALFLIKASAQCDHGEVRLVNGDEPNEGRVEVCVCSWGTVCDDLWDDRDAEVVCRQLGYRPDGAQSFQSAYFGQGQFDQAIVMDNVMCDANEMILLQCSHNGLFRHNCNHYEDAGVKCSTSEEEERLNINVDAIDVHTVLITWKLQNSTLHWSTSYVVKCFAEYKRHHIEMSTSNSTNSVQLMGLIPSTPYNCCVSAEYESYTYIQACSKEIVTIHPDKTLMTKHNGSDSNLVDMIIIIGGLLGFITAIVFILLVVCGIAILCLLRSRFSKPTIPKGSSQSVDRDITDVPASRNVSYITTTYRSPTSGSQPITAAGQSATEYGRIGSSYEAIHLRRQQPVVRVSARLPDRYEFSETYLAEAGSDGGGGIQSEASS